MDVNWLVGVSRRHEEEEIHALLFYCCGELRARAQLRIKFGPTRIQWIRATSAELRTQFHILCLYHSVFLRDLNSIRGN